MDFHYPGLSETERRIIRIEITINCLTNTVLNALCAWLLNRSKAAVPTDFWNVLLDLAITCFCICTLTSFFCSASAGRYLKNGGFTLRAGDGTWLSDLPRRPYLLGACLAGMTGLPLGALLGLGFTFLHVPVLPLAGFVLYKGLFGGILGGIVCSVVLLCRRVERGGRKRA